MPMLSKAALSPAAGPVAGSPTQLAPVLQLVSGVAVPSHWKAVACAKRAPPIMPAIAAVAAAVKTVFRFVRTFVLLLETGKPYRPPFGLRWVSLGKDFS